MQVARTGRTASRRSVATEATGSRSVGRSVGKSPAPAAKSPAPKAPSRGKAASAVAKTPKRNTMRATVEHRLETSLTDHIYDPVEETPRRSSRVTRLAK